MRNLQSLYGQRFQSYFLDIQKYMQFIISGHIAIVLLFVIGAAGYSYSEWLKTPPEGFPVFLVAASLLMLVVVPNRPALLLKQADHYYLLPMESKLLFYLKPALRWSVTIVVIRALVVTVVLLPLLTRVGELETSMLLALGGVVVAASYWNVHTKFHVLWGRPDALLLDFFVRALLLFGIFYFLLVGNLVLFIACVGLAGGYFLATKKMAMTPFPFDRMIDFEQQRMQRFYQFANYFTEVPHVRSKVSRRAWADGILTKKDLHSFLITRSFVRKDELFYMWIRLALLVIVFPFLSFSYVVAGLMVVFTFAIAIQTYQGLLFNQLFRMDMLYPQPHLTRSQAVSRFVRIVSYSPLAISLLVALSQHPPIFGGLGALAAVVSVEWYLLRKKKQP